MKITKTQEKQRLRSLVRQELNSRRQDKFFDTNLSAQNIPSAGTLQGLSLVPQGVGQSQRVADELFAKSLNVTWEIVQLNADIYSNSRLIIFQWFPSTNLGVPTTADILQSTGAVGLYSQYNWEFRLNYRILYDELIAMAGLVTSPCGISNISRLNILIKDFKHNFEYHPAATSGINQLYLLYISDSAATPFPLFSFASRLEYTDES
jgi:hypothetical protein